MQPAGELQKQLLLLNRVGSSRRYTKNFHQIYKTIVRAIIAVKSLMKMFFNFLHFFAGQKDLV